MTAAAHDEDGSLPDARRQLDDAISGLCDPKPQTLHDGRLTFVDSLYVQLRDAVPGGRGERSGLSHSQPPLWLDACDLLQQIDVAVHAWEHPFPALPGDLSHETDPVTVLRLRAVQTRPWRPQDTKSMIQIAKIIQEWVEDINGLFVDEPVRALWAAEGKGFAKCPACDVAMTKRLDRCGDLVQYPALQLSNDGTTRCMACKTSWGPQEARWVCRMLGYPLPSGVLE